MPVDKEYDNRDHCGEDGETAEYESPPGSALGQDDKFAELFHFSCKEYYRVLYFFRDYN